MKGKIAKEQMKQELDVDRIRADFPIFKVEMNGKPLIYLDSAATSQKPIQVINAISDFYKTYNANIHRGIYQISEKATAAYVDSKVKVGNFINAGMQEIIYTRNTTEAINLVAISWGNANVKKGEHILISEMEHHSNIVPWQLLAERKGAILDYVKLDSSKTRLDAASLEKELEKGPRVLAITHVSNVLGTINDIRSIVNKAHKNGVVVVVDGAQSAPHMKVDVRDMGCDFFAFSGHKMLGPTGTGVLYGKRELLEKMDPFISGGDMIKSVEHHGHTWNDLPWKFEAGTSDISGGIGLGAAIDYLNAVGMYKIRDHEKKLTKYALEQLHAIRGVKTYGLGSKDIDERGGVVAFTIDGIHPHDVSQVFDSEGIAIRSGHHCAMPLVKEVLFQVALSRMSFYLYNKESEIDKAVEAIQKTKKIFRLA